MSSTYLIQSDLTTTPTIAPTPFKFPLDPFQQHAVSAIQQEHNVLVCAKTGSGKTLVEAILKAKKKGGDNPIVMRVPEKPEFTIA